VDRGFAQNVDDREAPIRRIVDEQAKAWDAGDAAAFSRQIAPDVSFTQVFARRDGRWLVEAYHNVDVKAKPGSQ
jgi:hypothetical protein